MKFAKWLQLPTIIFVIIFASSNLVLAQTAPDLENGFKHYGSYDGSHLDTVNLQNGNLMLHAPLLPNYPQRGNLNLQDILAFTSKTWQVICADVQGALECGWFHGGTGVTLQRPFDLGVQRTIDATISPSSTTYSAAGYSLTSADGAMHQLVATLRDANGVPLEYESIDTTGYHVVLSGSDGSGIANTATVTDRHGNQFVAVFDAPGDCGAIPHTAPLPWAGASPNMGGGYAPMVDDAPSGDEFCPQIAGAQRITDSNGNVMNVFDPANTLYLGSDTLSRTPPLASITATTVYGDCVSANPVTSAWLLDYKAPDGSTRQMKMCFAQIPIQTAFNLTGVSEAQYGPALPPGSKIMAAANALPPLATVILADATKWVFGYDGYGELTSVSLPTGGSITYTWTSISQVNGCSGQTKMSRAVQTRTLDDGRGNTYKWTYNWGAVSGGVINNLVTDPLNNDTAHIFTALDGPNGCAFYETSTQYYQGLKSAGHLLKQVDTSYYPVVNFLVDSQDFGTGNVVAKDITTTVYPSGKVSKIHREYDQGLGTGKPIFGNVVKEQEFDWGAGAPGPLLRETDTVYKWQKDSAYLAARLLDLPASVVVISPNSASNTKLTCPINAAGGTASCMAETDYSYDEPGYLTTPTPAISTQHVAPPNGVRGNQTTVGRWLNTSGSFVSSHTNWLDTGEVYQHIDPLGHATTLTYDPSYVGAYPTQTCSPATGSVAHCVSGTYDFNTGALTSLTNENATAQASGNTFGDTAHTSNYSYDYMFRITLAQAPPDPANGSARPQTSFNFSAPNAFPLSVQRTKSITSSLTDSATSFFDGLGRSYQSQHVLPGGTSTVDTTLDFAGRPAIVSNPYFTTSDTTYGITTTLFDGLDRAYSVTKQDGSISSVGYNVVAGVHDAVVGANYPGDCTSSVDEAGNPRRACADALGRLVEVDEVNPGATASPGTGSILINGSEQASTQSGASGSGSVIISGSERGHTSASYDSGTVSLIINGHTETVTYGQGDTTFSVASRLAAALQSDPASLVYASASGAVISMTARQTGLATNYSFTHAEDWNESIYSTPGFYAANGALSGGVDPTSNPDSGTVTAVVSGTNYTVSYGAGDTSPSIATRLAAAINGGTWANASASGSQVNITSKTAGSGTNYTLAASFTWNTSGFASPSFTASPSGSLLSGGYDAGLIDNRPYVTRYQYDALGNLLRVDQKGTAPNDSTQWRTRTFTYDSLSRLLTANNPESGTISYSYDADGNLLQKTSPAPNQTGTATQTVSYCYDELHRVTAKGYGEQSCPLATPVVTYVYDSGTNAIGKLTSLTDQAGTASYSYDILGRLTAETRTLAGANNASISKNLSYEYNLDGSLYKLHYPSGNVVTYAPGAAGLALSAIDNGNNINYVTSATYGPDSALTGFISGYSTSFAGITNLFTFNKRLQPINMSANAPSQTVFSIGYDFHVGNGTSGADNGNVFGITNYKDATRNQTFTYDLLNRLTSAQNAGTNCAASTVNGRSEYWGNSYGYDAWGNLLQKSVTKCGAENLIVTADAHNWIHASGTDYQYDAAGNMTFNATAPAQTYSYDQENRLTGAAGYTYTYDADGNRVRKSNSSTGTLYWYMTPGIVGESDLSGNLTDEYVFFDGERVARKSTNGVFYYFSDHLKTASVITDASGNIKSESDFYPWGGELQFVNNDSNHYKFIGKERDSETQLDYFGARYYSNGLGRWVSADWSPTPIPVPYADFHNPQSLNLYGFVGGNPASKTDPDGHCCSLSEVVDFVGGVSQGIVASASFGAVGAPKSSDSNASLLGQAFGTIIEGAVGTGIRNAGASAVGVGLVAEAPSAGTSTAVVVTGAVGVVAGGAMETGAAKNVGGILNAMSGKNGTSGGPRAGKPFTPKDKAEVKAENAAAHGGQTTCEKCGQPTVPAQKHEAGVTPPGNETHVDHIIAQSQNGDGSKSNARVLCRDCNLKKGDK